jgi:AcrR family transcriptional regulator
MMSHPTHEALLQAGMRLAERHGLGNMSINAVVAEAGVAKGTFYVHFANRAAYLVALHQWFHNGLRSAIIDATNTFSPGVERLYQASETYLDTCLRARAVKALLLEARSEPAITEEIMRRNMDFAQLASADFTAMGWPAPDACARLYIVMVAEAALLELDAACALPVVRQALFYYLDNRSKRPAGRNGQTST